MDVLKNYLSSAESAIAPYPVLQALAVASVFVLLAVVVDKMCSRILVRFLTRIDSATGNRIVALLHRPVFTTVLLVGVLVASHRVNIDPSLRVVLVGIIGSTLVFIWAVLANRLVGVLLTTMVRSKRHFAFAHPTTAPMIRNAMAMLLFTIGAYAILATWNINVTGLVASAGIVGLALSFAAQDTLGNLFAGVSILADRPYEIGDYIVLDSGERGEVRHIGLRSTRLLTRDDVAVTIPNGVIARAKIVNEAASPRGQYRIRAEVGVAYGSDIRDVLAVLQEVAIRHEDICSTPAPRVRFRAFGDSALKMELLGWIRHPADRGRVLHELNCSIYETFSDHKINIPFPQREITMRDQRSEYEQCA